MVVIASIHIQSVNTVELYSIKGDLIIKIKIKTVMDKSIISVEISIHKIFFLFKTNPNIPIKKSIIDKLINYKNLYVKYVWLTNIRDGY